MPRMKLDYYQVNAFTNRPFAGNPAGVCILDRWLPERQLQAIAAENNLSETAFIVPRSPDFELRWFTPKTEIDLCGHATLASAFVLFNERKIAGQVVRFQSCRSGVLTVARRGELLELDFPARPPEPSHAPDGLVIALGAQPIETMRARDYLCVYEDEAAVRALQPDFAKLLTLDLHGVIVTAPGTDCDFVSRFFAPSVGVPEDPVTGSAHCTLIPYWSRRLDKTTLFARQVSRRGGELFCCNAGERVCIAGHAVLFCRGEIFVPDPV
jgi:PhzF family phenazine biosynthesis protein